MSSDTRKTRIRLPTVIIDGAPMRQPVEDDGSITRVPCFECDGVGLVTPDKRAEQRARVGAPPSSLPADRHEGKKP